jgi:pentatricopeptide repeat protein
VAPNVISFSAAISACEKGGQWQRALALLDEMRAKGVAPDVISFSAAISACEKGGQWQRALALLEEMRAKGVAPDVIAFSAAISACAHANQPERAMRLWDELPLVPNAVCFNAILDAVACWPRSALALWKLGLECGVFQLNQPYLQCVEGRATCLLDLHELSEGAAEAAIRWLFDEKLSRRNCSAMVTYDSTPVDGVHLITGWGRSRKVTQHGDLRARAIATLDRMGLSTLPTDNPGRLIVQFERAADVDAPPFQVFYRDLSGKHGTLDGVRHDDLSSTVLRRIAAKLGLSEAVTSTLRLIKAGKVLDLSAASLLAKGDTVHVLSRLDGGIRIREVESASGAALTDAPCATSSDGDAEDASDVANVPDPACDDREDDDDDSDDYESDGHAPGLSAMFHGMAELTNGRVCIAGSYALHHYLRVHRGVDGWPCWTPGDIDIFYCPHGGELDGDELRRCLVHMARCCQVQMCGAGEVGTFQQHTSACYPAQVKGDSIEDSEDEASVAAFAREQLLSLCVRERPRAREYALQCRARTARLRVGSVAHARLCAPTGTGSARAPSSSTPPHVTASHCVPSSTSWRWSPWGTLRRLAPTLNSPLAFLLDSTSCRARSRTSAARARS